MQRYWSSLRYSFLRTVSVGCRLRRHPTPAHPFPVSSVVLVWPVPRGVSVIPHAVSLRVSISQSTGILGIPLPALLSNNLCSLAFPVGYHLLRLFMCVYICMYTYMYIL